MSERIQNPQTNPTNIPEIHLMPGAEALPSTEQSEEWQDNMLNLVASTEAKVDEPVVVQSPKKPTKPVAPSHSKSWSGERQRALSNFSTRYRSKYAKPAVVDSLASTERSKPFKGTLTEEDKRELWGSDYDKDEASQDEKVSKERLKNAWKRVKLVHGNVADYTAEKFQRWVNYREGQKDVLKEKLAKAATLATFSVALAMPPKPVEFIKQEIPEAHSSNEEDQY